MPRFSEIFRRFVDCCLPYQLPEPWHRLDTSGVAVTLPPNLQDVVNEVVKEFGADAVLETGLVSRTDSDPVEAEILTTCDGILVPIYDQTGTKIEDFITSKGCLSGQPVPVIPAWDDEDVLEDLGCLTPDVYVATSLPEFVIFLALGMPVTFYCGQENHPHGYDLLTHWAEAEHTPRRRPGSDMLVSRREPEPDPELSSYLPYLNTNSGCELFLIAVDLVNFTSSRSAQSEYLETLAKSHPGDLITDVFRWSPSDEKIRQLQLMLTSASPGNLRNWIVASRESSVRPLKSDEDLSSKPTKTNLPGDLLGMLDLAYTDPSDWPTSLENVNTDEAYQHLDRLIYQQLTRPLLTDTANHSNPAVANIQTQLAMLSQICHRQAVSLLAKNHKGRRSTTQIFAEATENLLPMMQMCLKQYQAIRAAERSGNRTIANRRRLND